MPYSGLGLHVIIALCFANHALRTGRQRYWLLLLFSFPLLGSAVYFFAEYSPELRCNRTPRDGMNAVNSAGAKECFFRDEAFYRAYERPEPRSLFSHASRLSPRLRLRWSTSGFYAVINEDL